MKTIEQKLEHGLFASRWLMAPFYVGLVGALAILLISFMQELSSIIINIAEINHEKIMLGIISLVGLSMAGNLLFIVVLSGYRNIFAFSTMRDDPNEAKELNKTYSFFALKLKVISYIVIISGIHLLKVFMDVDKANEHNIKWMVIIHLVFVVSGVLLAIMDYIAIQAKYIKKK